MLLKRKAKGEKSTELFNDRFLVFPLLAFRLFQFSCQRRPRRLFPCRGKSPARRRFQG